MRTLQIQTFSRMALGGGRSRKADKLPGCLAVGRVHAPQLAGCQHQDVFLLLVEPQLLPSQPGFVQLPVGGGQFPGEGPRDVLLPADPVHRHLIPDVIVQGPVGVVSQHLLARQRKGT